jgi:hypothetical protein
MFNVCTNKIIALGSKSIPTSFPKLIFYVEICSLKNKLFGLLMKWVLWRNN